MSAHAFTRRRQQVEQHGHVSGVFLLHLARCVVEAVPDARQREDLVDRACVLLSADDAAVLRQNAGVPLPPDPAQGALAL